MSACLMCGLATGNPYLCGPCFAEPINEEDCTLPDCDACFLLKGVA